MKINFTKMQGLGNDFILLDFEEFKKTNKNPDQLALMLCDRKFSIGADGLIIVNPEVKNTDIGWIFYNSDGTMAQMCGNGMRCFAKYVTDKKIIKKQKFSVETKAGIIEPELLENGEIKVNMNLPILDWKKIPFGDKKNLDYNLKIKDKTFSINAVSMGNPHCIIFTKEDTMLLAKNYGPEIERHQLFPEKTNVEFVNIISRKEVTLSVWERGCGITLACGTGACATTVAGILRGFLDNTVKVNLPGGTLNIEWLGSKKNTNYPVFMTGRADYSFEGRVDV